jgi:hypothetical protein
MGGSGSGDSPGGAVENKASAFSFVKGFLPKYFSSEWSLAQFKLPECTRSLVGWCNLKPVETYVESAWV